MSYDKPTPDDLIMRYPDFADTPPTSIAYWLTDAERSVSTAWIESDYAPGLMALAAHNMALGGLGSQSEATADLPAGITSMKIGTLGLAFDGALTRAKAQGTWGATKYGLEFVALRRRSLGGPRVMATGTVPLDNIRYPHGQA